MSGSETGVMTSREPFTVGFNKPQQPLLQNMRLAYGADGTAVYKPVATTTSPAYHSSTTVTAPAININGAGAVGSGGGGGGGGIGGGVSASLPQDQGVNVNMGSNSGEPLKRKRGRPRKYGPDGAMALGMTQTSSAVGANQPSGAFSPPAPAPPSASASAAPNSMKKARGRPRGSTNKKQQLDALSLGSAGFGFMPHVIIVKPGEDLSSKIMSFSQNGPRAVCILSANGSISNVTLRQPNTSGGTVTYEGRFEILSLSGSFLLSEIGGQRSRSGGLSVSLSGPDGRVLGGGVAGLLIAASPVQVVVGSFAVDGRRESKSTSQMESFSTMPPQAGQSSSPSRGTLSESSGGPGSPLNLSTGTCNNNNNPQGISGMPWK